VRARSVFGWLSAMGAAAQASVPGVYAWATTVAPAAWSRGSSAPYKVAAITALLALVAGVAGEPRWGERARFASVWAFVLSSAVAWSAAPAAMGSLRVDSLQGLAGMVGWALFALTSAAPALDRRSEAVQRVEGEPLATRSRPLSGDVAYVVGAAVGAVALQVVGWRVATAERALLVRFVALAGGLAVIGAGSDLALARHASRPPMPRLARVRRGLGAFVLLAMLAAAGVLFALRG
jgi:hypothetical protein